MEDKKPQLLIEFRIPSRSESGTLHVVKIYSDGEIKCDCIAFSMKKVKMCRHQKIVIRTLKDLIQKIEERYKED